MPKKEKNPPVKQTSQEKQKKLKQQMWSPAPSLKPGKTAIESAAEGHPYAVAIRDIWRFNAPITTMTPEVYKRLVERSTVTFGG